MYRITYDFANRWDEGRDLSEVARDERELSDMLFLLRSEGGYHFRITDDAGATEEVA